MYTILYNYITEKNLLNNVSEKNLKDYVILVGIDPAYYIQAQPK